MNKIYVHNFQYTKLGVTYFYQSHLKNLSNKNVKTLKSTHFRFQRF